MLLDLPNSQQNLSLSISEPGVFEAATNVTYLAHSLTSILCNDCRSYILSL